MKSRGSRFESRSIWVDSLGLRGHRGLTTPKVSVWSLWVRHSIVLCSRARGLHLGQRCYRKCNWTNQVSPAHHQEVICPRFFVSLLWNLGLLSLVSSESSVESSPLLSQAHHFCYQLRKFPHRWRINSTQILCLGACSIHNGLHLCLPLDLQVLSLRTSSLLFGHSRDSKAVVFTSYTVFFGSCGCFGLLVMWLSLVEVIQAMMYPIE